MGLTIIKRNILRISYKYFNKNSTKLKLEKTGEKNYMKFD